MNPPDFVTLVHDYNVALLDASNPDERQDIATEISDDPELCYAILMLLSEQIIPLLPPLSVYGEGTGEGLLQ